MLRDADAPRDVSPAKPGQGNVFSFHSCFVLYFVLFLIFLMFLALYFSYGYSFCFVSFFLHFTFYIFHIMYVCMYMTGQKIAPLSETSQPQICSLSRMEQCVHLLL